MYELMNIISYNRNIPNFLLDSIQLNEIYRFHPCHVTNTILIYIDWLNTTAIS